MPRSSNPERLKAHFYKVSRRGCLMDRYIVLDEVSKTLEYHRYRKILSIQRITFYQVMDIVDLREGWRTQKFLKIEAKERKKWLKGKRRSYNAIREEDCFSIILDNGKTIDLIASGSEKRNRWLNSLKAIIWEAKVIKRKVDRHRFIERCFHEIDHNDDGLIDFTQSLSILDRLNVSIHHEMARDVFQKSIATVKIVDNQKVLNLEEFIQFFESLENRLELLDLFKKYSKPGNALIGQEELQIFLTNEQNMQVTLNECQQYIEKFSRPPQLPTTGSEAGLARMRSNHRPVPLRVDSVAAILHGIYLTYKGFEAMLLSPEFDLFNYNHSQVYQDMDKPLNYYYILSSHNTYLLAGQLIGDSSIEAYIDALRRGYRCIELDIWDGDDVNGPIVYHGYTMVTRITLRDVLEAIAEYAFETTPYPLILSLEVNCSEEQQELSAAMLISILGDQLYRRPTHSTETQLPSPEMLKYKILVKTKRQQSVLNLYNYNQDKYNSNSSSSSLNNSDDEEPKKTRKRKSERKKSIFKKSPSRAEFSGEELNLKLSDLAIYCSAKKFTTLQDTLNWKFNEMFSLSENKSFDLAYLNTHQYIQATSKHLARVYPKGSRINSSNFSPTHHWNVGVQMVALNIQTFGKHLLINETKFRTNGNCGYVTKPIYLMKGGFKDAALMNPMIIELIVISAQQLPISECECQDEDREAYINISVIGHPDDYQKMVTKTVKNNSFNPIWFETFVVKIIYPELAFLYFKCKDSRKTGKDSKIGINSVPVTSITEGYRHLHLLDSNGKKIEGCTIFLKVRIS